MAKINDPPPRAPMWPWGGPRSVQERLVDPHQLYLKKKLAKKGDARNPALASFALLESIGGGHNSEELRFPMPPHPKGHDADLEGFSDRGGLAAVAARNDPEARGAIDRLLSRISAAPERLDRMKALLSREGKMLTLVGQLNEEVELIRRRIREEQKNEGF